MNGCVQWDSDYGWGDFCLQNPGQLNQQARAWVDFSPPLGKNIPFYRQVSEIFLSRPVVSA